MTTAKKSKTMAQSVTTAAKKVARKAKKGLEPVTDALASGADSVKAGARTVAPVVVERIDSPAGGEGFHTPHLDCGTQLRTRSILAATGVGWWQLEVEVRSALNRLVSITPAPPWRPRFTTIKMSPSLALKTRPDRPRCF